MALLTLHAGLGRAEIQGQLTRQVWILSCMGALVGLLSHGLFDCALWGNRAAFVPWMMVAFVRCAAEHGHARLAESHGAHDVTV